MPNWALVIVKKENDCETFRYNIQKLTIQLEDKRNKNKLIKLYFMKKQLFIISALFISMLGFSQGIEFEHGTWKEVLEKSKQTGKPIFVAVSYTHLRAHETDSYLVCRLLLE